MSRFLTILWCVLVAATLFGCKDAKKFVDESKEGYRIVKEIAGKVTEIASSVDTNDFAKAKGFATTAERYLNTRVLSWAVQILAIEERDGVDAAKALIERLKASDGIKPDELAALVEMEKYYQGKGSERTGDLVVLVAAFAVESKYGHGAGGVLLKICEAYRTSPSGVATNTPTN